MVRYNNIHRQQLFHWIGRHIDEGAGNTGLSDPLRKEYVDCLEGAIKNGLWVKTPQNPDQLGDGTLIKVHRPIVCFTEWSLEQIQPHTTRYGRLGLGFPKRFVLERGGQPLIYVRDHCKGDPYTAALKALAQYLRDAQASGKLTADDLGKLRSHFDYLAHFAKRIKKPVTKPVPRTGGKKGVVPKPKRLPSPPDLFLRSYGKTLHFLEEREWRIVYDDAIADHFFDSSGKPGLPEHYLPFTPGSELFTVVLPDNHTVNMALDRKPLHQLFFPKNAPHVTVLSLQDIGTF